MFANETLTKVEESLRKSCTAKNEIDSSPLNEKNLPDETTSLITGSKRKKFRSTCSKKLSENLLVLLTVCGVVIGLLIGIILSTVGISETTTVLVGFPGELLLRMLKMLVLPLISASIIVGMNSLSGSESGQLEKRIFYRTITYFMVTTLFAVILGILLVSLVRPGSYGSIPDDKDFIDGDNSTTIVEQNALDSVLGVFRSMFPDNLVVAAAELNILGVITFSLVLGWTLSMMGEKGKPLLVLFESLNEAIMKIVLLIMWYAPFGILSLIAARLGEHNDFIQVLSDIGMFAATVIIGLLVHCLIVLPSIYFLFLRTNPYKYYWGFLQALLTALGTDSSAATLPVTLQCIEHSGISDKIAKIVLPLGVTLNMNGTALYEAVSALFVAQLHNIQLSVGQMVIVALTATLAAVIDF